MVAVARPPAAADAAWYSIERQGDTLRLVVGGFWIVSEARRLDPGLRVLDRQAFVRQHRIALAQQITDAPESRDEPVGFGLAAFDVLRRG